LASGGNSHPALSVRGDLIFQSVRHRKGRGSSGNSTVTYRRAAPSCRRAGLDAPSRSQWVVITPPITLFRKILRYSFIAVAKAVRRSWQGAIDAAWEEDVWGYEHPSAIDIHRVWEQDRSASLYSASTTNLSLGFGQGSVHRSGVSAITRKCDRGR